MNPLFIIGVGAGAFLIYESLKASNVKKFAKAGRENIPLASSPFSNMRENPFQQKEKILVENIQPTQKGQLTNPKLAGRWMLTLPGGTYVPIHCSFERLKKKVIIILKTQPKKDPKGLSHIEGDRYHLESASALEQMFEQ